jgi:tetratricopeptide (TPR) repeat protein
VQWAKILASQAILLGLAFAQAPDPEKLFNEAMRAQQRGDLAGAARGYRGVVQVAPDVLPAWVNLGVTLVRMERYAEAIDAYRRALALDPGNRQIQYYLALAYFKKGDASGASGQLEELLKTGDRDVSAATLLGECYLRLGKPDKALALLAPFTSAARENPDLAYELGSALILNGKARQGADLLEAAARQSNGADAYLLAGVTLLRLNEFERARGDLEEAALLNPKLPGVFAALGSAREKAADRKGAAEAFRKALEQNPADFEANLELGAVLYTDRDIEGAREYLNRALAIDPNSELALYEIALVKKASGQLEAAVNDLEKVVKADPEWLPAHIELAALYFRIHRPAEGDAERKIVDQLSEAQQKAGPGAGR